MSLPRFFVAGTAEPREGLTVALEAAQARHANVLRLRPGDAAEVVLSSGPWRADLAETGKDRALLRLVAPLSEDREPPVSIAAWIPLTAQLSLVDELLPPLVELGATLLQPVVYARSEYDARKTLARKERWDRIILSACEQSHRTRIPELREPKPFEALLALDASQKWVAYETVTGRPNPRLTPGPIAFTSGPEGGITEAEFASLIGAGWLPVSLGRSILRAVTAPLAMMGAIQYELGTQS